MEIPLYLLILLIEWVMLVTVAAPMFFAGRFDKTPNIGIWLWFTVLISAVLATAVSAVIATVSIFTTWQNLSAGQNLGITLLAKLCALGAAWRGGHSAGTGQPATCSAVCYQGQTRSTNKSHGQADHGLPQGTNHGARCPWLLCANP